MSQAKRKRDDEPSTSSGSGPKTRKKKIVPGTYRYNHSDEVIVWDFNDSGSEWEASPPEMESYIADGGLFTTNVNISENLAIDPSIRNASITENSDGRGPEIQNNGGNNPLLLMSIVTTNNPLGGTTNAPLIDTAVPDAGNNNTIKHGK